MQLRSQLRASTVFCFIFQRPALGRADMPFAIIPTKPYTFTPAASQIYGPTGKHLSLQPLAQQI